jgi:hypothetical protein
MHYGYLEFTCSARWIRGCRGRDLGEWSLVVGVGRSGEAIRRLGLAHATPPRVVFGSSIEGRIEEKNIYMGTKGQS